MGPAAWSAAELCPHLVLVIARVPTNSARFASVTKPPSCRTCNAYARTSSVAARWRRRPSTSARVAANAWSASAAAPIAISLIGPSAWAVSALNATHPCCWSICLARRWLRLTELSTAPREWAWTCRSARAELGKPLRGFPTCPHPEGLRRSGALRFCDTTNHTNQEPRGGLMVVVTAWPNGRGERQPADRGPPLGSYVAVSGPVSDRLRAACLPRPPTGHGRHAAAGCRAGAGRHGLRKSRLGGNRRWSRACRSGGDTRQGRQPAGFGPESSLVMTTTHLGLRSPQSAVGARRADSNEGIEAAGAEQRQDRAMAGRDSGRRAAQFTPADQDRCARGSTGDQDLLGGRRRWGRRRRPFG